MSDELVRIEKRDGGVAVLTLSAPPANTYSYEMMRALDAAILDLRMDEEVYALVLTGAGDKFFCAGADIGMLKEADPSFKYWFCLHANETLNRLEQTPKLVVAALGGHTVGGGFEIAMACDIRIARQGKAKVGLPEVKLGVLPGTGGTARLTRLVGKARALEMMVEGTNLGVDEAKEAGLIHKTWEADSQEAFLDQVVDYARGLCPPKTASKAVGLIKRSVASGGEMSFESHLALERELQQRLFESADAKEGILAYSEKREAKFGGR